MTAFKQPIRNKHLVWLLSAILVLCGCGSDDGVVAYDRDFTQVSYSVKPAFDLQRFYTVRVIYTDFHGQQHEEVIENSTEWSYKEKESGHHPIQCRIIATAKSAEQYGTLDRETYAFTWEYTIHWHQEKSGAKSLQPSALGRSVKRDEVTIYLAENPTIILLDFNQP